MLRTMLKSKIRRVRSLTLDEDLMEAADLLDGRSR
jgi:aspartate 1-decarboxylase